MISKISGRVVHDDMSWSHEGVEESDRPYEVPVERQDNGTYKIVQQCSDRRMKVKRI